MIDSTLCNYTLTIHLSHGAHEVFGVLEADESVALGFLGVPVSDNFRPEERGKSREAPRQCIVIHIVTKVTNKDAKIICV